MHAPKDRKYSQIKCHSRYAGEERILEQKNSMGEAKKNRISGEFDFR